MDSPWKVGLILWSPTFHEVSGRLWKPALKVATCFPLVSEKLTVYMAWKTLSQKMKFSYTSAGPFTLKEHVKICISRKFHQPTFFWSIAIWKCIIKIVAPKKCRSRSPGVRTGVHMDQLFGTFRAKMLPMTKEKNAVRIFFSGHSRVFLEMGRAGCVYIYIYIYI